MSRLNPKSFKAQQGATLVELLVTLLIAGVAFAGIYQIYTNSIRTTSVQDQVVNMQQSTRVVMDQIMRELRLAGYSPNAPTGMAGFQKPDANPLNLSASGKQLIIQGDFIPDNATIPDEVTYWLDKTTDPNHPTLFRSLKNGPQKVPFGINVEGLIVTFYDSNNNQMAVPMDETKIRRVSLQLTVRTDSQDNNFKDPVHLDGYRRRTLISDVVLRNAGKARDVTPPPCPINVKAFITGGCRVIRVTWDRPADIAGDLAGYYIYYDQAAISTGTSPFVNYTDDKNATSFFYDVTVPNTGSWNIAMSSYDQSGNLCDNISGNGYPPADPVTAGGSPVNVGAPTKTPSAPPNPLAKPSDNQVSLSWGQVVTYTDGTTAAGLAGYRLYRATQADMSDQVMIANEFALPISQVVGGSTSYTTDYVDSDGSTLVGGSPAGPKNCQIYYYQVSVADQCNLESGHSTVQSAKPNGTVSPGVTPPDNGLAPPAPAITYLEAGDDTSNIIIGWAVPAPTSSQSAPVGVRIYYRVKGTSAWTMAVDLPFSTPLPASGTQIVNDLTPNTTYDVKLAAYDDTATACGDETPSGVSSVFTGACAPHLDPADPAHRIYPGIGIAGSYVATDGSAVLGLLSPSAQQYLTWVAAPTDCTPDSANFAAQGYDYKNPPAYHSVAYDSAKGIAANVQFFINDSGGADQTADVRYGTAATGVNPGNLVYPSNFLNFDAAPRGTDKFYHFPSDPISPSHLDTAMFCDAQYDFKVMAVDGEQYSASSTIPLTIKNGGIEVNPGVPVTSDISTVDDDHHIVRFGIRNTNAAKQFKLNKITLTWDNNFAFLQKLEVLTYDAPRTVIGQWDSTGGSPTGLAGIGTELTLNLVPTLQERGIPTNADKAYIQLTFKDSTGSVTSFLDMRSLSSAASETITINSLNYQDAAALGGAGVCTMTTAGSVAVRKYPLISAADTVQDQPSIDTIPKQSPGAIVLNTNNPVTVTTRVTPDPSRAIKAVKLYYKASAVTVVAAPARPASPGGGGNYASTVSGTYAAATDTWSFVIPANPAKRVWFYLEAVDGTATDSFSRNFDIYPDSGVFTYDQPGSLVIALTGSWNPDAACPSPDQVALSGTVTDSLGAAVSGATVSVTMLDTNGGSASGIVPTNGSGVFSFNSGYVFTADATASVTVSAVGFNPKSCALTPIPYSNCLGTQTLTCN